MSHLHRRPLHHRVLFVVVYAVIVGGLVTAIVVRANDEQAKDDARPAVCQLFGDLYRAALEGPVAPDAIDDWDLDAQQVATKLSALATPFDIDKSAFELRGSVYQRRPGQLRWAARNVGCNQSTFPPIPDAIFDSTPVEWPEPTTEFSAAPAIVTIPGARLPPASAVTDVVSDMTLTDLAELGVPVDKMPLLDPTQARIAWVQISVDQSERMTVVQFVTEADDDQTVVASIMDFAATIPELRGATRRDESPNQSVLDLDLRERLRVSTWAVSGSGRRIVQITRTSRMGHAMVLSPAMTSVSDYADGPLTGARPTLDSWYLAIGTNPRTDKVNDIRILVLHLADQLEPSMNTFARRVGAWSVDGSHLAHDEFTDATFPEYRWKFAQPADVNVLYLIADKNPN